MERNDFVGVRVMPMAAHLKQAFPFFTLFACIAIFLAGCSSSEERAEGHYKRGLELVEAGELTKAGLEFRNALRLKSDHVDALFAFGEIQEKQGEVQAAFRIFNSVAEQSSEHVPARLKLVYLLLTANQTDQARRYLDEAAAVAPDDPEVVLAEATFQLKSSKPEEAERLAKAVLQENPNLIEGYIVLASSRVLSNDAAGALKFLDQTPESGKDDAGLQLLRLSILNMLGDDAGIEAQLADMVERFPDSPQFGIAWSQWYLSKNRPDDAEQVMRRVAKSRPDDDSAQMRLVSFLLSQQGPEAAKSELAQMIESREQENGDPFPLQAAFAQMQYQTGSQSEAIDFMQSVLAKVDGTDQEIQARIMLAAMLLEANEIGQAEGYVSEVLEVDTKNVEALRMRAAIKLSNGDSAGAADDVLLALNEAPNDARLRIMLANAHERNGSSVLAEEEYAKAFALDNQSAEAGLPMVRYLLSHGRTEQAERVLEAIRTQEPTNREVLTLIAQQKLARRDFVGAQEIADILRNSNDQDYSGVADRITAAALGGQNKYDESLDFLEKTVAASQNENQALLPELVRAYVQSGRQNLAIEKLNTTLKEDPGNIQARILLGAVYLSDGKNKEAEETFKQAASDENSAAGNTALAQYYFSVRDLDKAEETIKAGLEKDEGSVALQMLLTTAYQQAERFEEAIAIYEKMFEENPSSTVVANDLASLLSERRGDEASLDRALEIAQRFRTSEVPQYQDTLGWIYYLRGEYSSALPLLRISAERLPRMGLAQFHYGMTLAALNQKDQAIEALEKALDLKTLMTEKDQEVARATVERLKKPETTNESN